jgi:hypothetical protein
MDELVQEVQEFQERWNSMVLDITEDLKITCDEAHRVRRWLVTERRAYNVLKKKINLDTRSVRHDYDRRDDTLNADDRKEAKIDLARIVHANKTLLLAVDELLLKADEMSLRVERLLKQCQEEE